MLAMHCFILSHSKKNNVDVKKVSVLTFVDFAVLLEVLFFEHHEKKSAQTTCETADSFSLLQIGDH